jgi:hypothetical protein
MNYGATLKYNAAGQKLPNFQWQPAATDIVSAKCA